MFRYQSLEDQLSEERKKNAALKAQNAKNAADIDYIAMMTDIELDSDESEVNGNE